MKTQLMSISASAGEKPTTSVQIKQSKELTELVKTFDMFEVVIDGYFEYPSEELYALVAKALVDAKVIESANKLSGYLGQ